MERGNQNKANEIEILIIASCVIQRKLAVDEEKNQIATKKRYSLLNWVTDNVQQIENSEKNSI